MSTAASQTAQLAFQIAHVAVYSEVRPKEVATAAEGLVTGSLGSTQIALYRVFGRSPLTTGDPYEIRAAKPYDFAARNMTYIGEREDGGLVFLASVE